VTVAPLQFLARAMGWLRDSPPSLDRLGLDATPVRAAPLRLRPERAWAGHIPFAFWLAATLRPRLFVELGTHTGTSYSAFCQGFRALGLETRAFAVDTWRGDEHAGHYGEEVHAELSAFNAAEFGAFSTLLRMSFDDALSRFEDGSIDLLHIDGLHTYEAVRHDFESWRPKLSQDAIVLFHDTNEFQPGFAVFRFFAELAQTCPHFEFLHSHGLGVIALTPQGAGRLRGLLRPAGWRPFSFSRRRLIMESEVRDYFAALGSALQA